MKILHIVPSYKPAYVYGGPIESVAKLCEGLVAAGQYIEVYTTTANGASELPVRANEKVEVDGVPVTYFKRITKDHTHISPALWRSLYRHCREFDIVHIHSWWNPLVVVAAMICHWRKVKVVISPRGMLSNYILEATHSRIKTLIQQMGGKKALLASTFHATAENEYDDCKRIDANWRGFVIPNLLELPAFPIIKKRNPDFTLLFLSRVHPKKGIELLLDAILQLPPDIRLQIAGEGEEEYMAQLKRRINDLGIGSRVQWLGWLNREQKFVAMMEADLFVLPSYNENFANTVIESLHSGTPVLVSDQVGLASFVSEQGMGWITALNKDDIASCISDAKAREETCHNISVRSRELIERRFSQTKLIEEYVSAYERSTTA